MARTLPSDTRRVSSKDVAREAGVSQSTVSRVFNETGIPVSEKRRARVMAAANKLGYRPSIIARSLNNQSTKIIGIVIRRFDNEFYMRSLDRFSLALQDKGFSVMLFNLEDDAAMEDNLATALEYQVAGLIITSAHLTSPLVEGCIRFNTPVFLFNRISEGLKVDAVCNDNFAAGQEIAEYLHSAGHRNMVFVTGEKQSSTNKQREEGFVSRLRDLGVTDVRIVEGDFYYRSGFDAAAELIEEGTHFDAVFCASDYMAMGFYDYVRTRTRLAIPEDFSLVGFDGITIPNEEVYPITTYRQPLEQMVDTTVEALLKKIKRYDSVPQNYFIKGVIVERETVMSRLPETGAAPVPR